MELSYHFFSFQFQDTLFKLLLETAICTDYKETLELTKWMEERVSQKYIVHSDYFTLLKTNKSFS